MANVFVLLPHGWRGISSPVADDTRVGTPYDYGLASSIHHLSWSRSAADGRLRHFFRFGLRHLLGFDLLHALENLRSWKGVDVVWTHTEWEHLAVACIRLFLKRKPHLVSQSVWLWDHWAESPGLKRALHHALLKASDVELVHSSVNLAAAQAKVPGRAVHLLPYGPVIKPCAKNSPTSAASPLNGRPLLLGLGNDRHRDWLLLSQVARLLPEWDVAVVTPVQRRRLVIAHSPSNFSVHEGLPEEGVRAMFEHSSVIAVPLKKNLHASGTTVLVESLASGKPLVVSKTGGLEQYCEGAAVELVPLGDATAFAMSARAALARSAEARVINSKVRTSRGLTSQDYVNRYLLVTDALLRGSRVPPEVSQFKPCPTF